LHNNLSDRLPADRQPAVRVLAMPEHSAPYGGIFGGWIMAQADIAGAIPALEAAGGRVATVSVNHFEFHRPVFIGDLLSYYARVLKTGRTSIQVEVEVFAQRYPSHRDCVRVTEAVITYVAVDEGGKPRPIAPPPS
jgi:acyl-CoA thioesterase YciA